MEDEPGDVFRQGSARLSASLPRLPEMRRLLFAASRARRRRLAR